MSLAPQALPFVTSGSLIPSQGGGAMKVDPADFEVEELPDVSPAGEGEHLYLWVEKRGRDTVEVARELATKLGVASRDVGYAGLKDRHAVTRQWFSAQVKAGPDSLELTGARVLATSRHAHKLRTGALRGNRFWILLRGATDAEVARERLEALSRSGVPNWFGPQRFGRAADNAQLGAALLGLGEHPSARNASRDRFLRKLALSALQSELFNRLLATRVSEGRLAQVEVGDVLEVSDDPRPVVATDPGPLAPAVAAFRAAVTGPMFGSRMTQAAGAPRDREDAVLRSVGLTGEHLARGGRELLGTRRPYRVPLGDVVADQEPDGLRLRFDLPAGSYATSVLRELTR